MAVSKASAEFRVELFVDVFYSGMVWALGYEGS